MEKHKVKRQYSKLHGQKRGRLVFVKKVYADQLTDDFLKFNYQCDDTIALSDLPRGYKLLVLYFVADNNIPFPELLNFTSQRLEKFKALEGEEYEFFVLEPKEPEIVQTKNGLGRQTES